MSKYVIVANNGFNMDEVKAYQPRKFCGMTDAQTVIYIKAGVLDALALMAKHFNDNSVTIKPAF